MPVPAMIYLVSTMGDDRPVPREDNPRRFIGKDPVAVPAPLSTYYHRRIADGELVEAPAPASAPDAAVDAAQPSSTPKAKAKPSTPDQGGK